MIEAILIILLFVIVSGALLRYALDKMLAREFKAHQKGKMYYQQPRDEE